MPELLTEAEVAERLRCSVARVRKLRAAGRLAYLPGRPILVTEADFAAFVETERCQRRSKSRSVSASSEASEPKVAGLTAEQRGRLIWLQHAARSGRL